MQFKQGGIVRGGGEGDGQVNLSGREIASGIFPHGALTSSLGVLAATGEDQGTDATACEPEFRAPHHILLHRPIWVVNP
jgi:hypothetical protein